MLAVVLAGGENRRYPLPKGLIEVRGQKIIERHIDIFRSLDLKPHISTNSPELYGFTGVPLIADTVPSRGPMSGIVSAFEATEADELLVTACDMPFILTEMIEYIISHRSGEATVPAPAGVPEPLLAVYTRSALEKMRKCLSQGNASMRDILRQLDTRLLGDEEIRDIDPEGVCFVNINTPGDYQRIFGNTGES
jgi:molybdopterin-guanine dinucleotide biosynthesis protein A